MDNPIKVNIKLDFPDFYRFQLRHIRGKSKFLMYIMLFYVSIIIFAFFSNTLDWYKHPSDFLPFSFFILVPGLVLLSVYFNSKKYFENDVFIRKEHAWIINESGFENSNENSNVKMTWEEVYKFVISKKDVTIYCSPAKAFILPKRFFEENQLNKLTEILKSKVISKEKSTFFSKYGLIRIAIYLVIIVGAVYVSLNTSSAAEDYFKAGVKNEKELKYEAAMSEFNKAIKADPDYASAFCHRGYVRGMMGDYEGEQYDCKRAIEIDENYSNAYLLRGYARYQLNDSIGACNDLYKAKELGDTNAVKAIEAYCK